MRRSLDWSRNAAIRRRWFASAELVGRTVRPPSLSTVAFVLVVLLASIGSVGTAESVGAAQVAEKQPVEVAPLRTARSETFLQGDGSFRTVISSVPVHYREQGRGWQKIKNRLVGSKRAGFEWANEAAGFKADLKGDVRDGVVRFETGNAGFTLTLEGAASAEGAKSRDVRVSYKNVFAHTDLEYVLLPTGIKETLVLNGAGAPNEFVFRLLPLPGKEFTLVGRSDGGLDVRTAASAEPVAVISAPIVNDSKRLLVDDDTGKRTVVVDDLPAAGKAVMSATRAGDGSYRLVLAVDEKWLSDPARVFPVKLDPTVTTAVDLQDGYWNMTQSAQAPNTTSSSLVVSADGTGSWSNGTIRHNAGLLFSLGDIPAGASVTSTQLSMYWSGCYPSGCGFWYPEDGEGQVGQVQIRRFSGAWGPATPSGSLSVDSTVLASQSYAVWWGSDQPGVWRHWTGSALTSHVQGVVNGSVPNFGLEASLAPSYGGWGLTYASAEYGDPNYAPKLEVQWISDGVQLHPSTNVHSDGAELTWTRFAPGYGPYVSTILQDDPRAYWRLNDANGSPFGLTDWSGNNLHASPVAATHGQTGATADGDTAIYYNGSSTRTEASETQITDTFTIEAWVKRGSLGGKQTIFSRGESSGGGFRLLLDANNYLALSSGDYDGPTFRTFARSANPIADTSTYHHVAASKSGSSVHIYVDGVDQTVMVDSVPTLTSGLGIVVTGAAIGSDYQNGGRWYADYLNGWIDEPAVYGTVLSASQILAHKNAAAQPGSGFVRFEVHRSPNAGFTPTASTLIATVRDPVIQHYRDTTARASTTLYYKVVTVGTGGAVVSNQLTVPTPAAGHATITIQPGVSLHGAEATTIASGSACSNNGGAGGITASSSQRGIVRFDLRQIPTGSDITDADVSLWTFQSGGGRTIDLHRATADWVEGAGSGACDGSGATWSDRQPNVPWSSAGGEFAGTPVTSFTSTGATPHWESADVTSLVEDWVGAGKPNFGLLVKQANEAGAPAITWTSDDYSGSAALRPKLVATYADGSDPKEPSVMMGAPGGETKLSGTVSVTAAAGDDSRVTQVEFLHGATVFATDTAAPWQATLDTSALPRGSLELKARATDDVGHVTTSSLISVTVANSAAPSTAVTGVTGAAVLTVGASASDDVAVTKVEFYVDGDRFATDSSSPYEASLDTLGFPVYDGSHTLTTRAYDADGNATTSAGVPTTVANTTGTAYQAAISSADTQSATTEIPVGAVLPYAGSIGSIPAGWALADGSALSRTTYGGLFGELGTAYGAGDGSSTFNLPDLRGRLPLGKAAAGTGSTLGASGGSLNMGGGTINLPTIASLPFPTPAVTFSAGGVSAFVPSGFSFPTGQHYNFWTGDSALASVSVGGGGGLASGWTTFSMPSQTATSGPVTPTASLATATAAYRVVNYIVKTTPAATAPLCSVWPSARTSLPAGATRADGSTASGSLAACLASEYAGSTPDLRGRFPLGKTASGTASMLNDSGGARDLTHAITRNVPASTVTVPNYSKSLPVPGGSYPASYTWRAFGQGNGSAVWLFRCSGGGGSGSCLPGSATTPSVATPSASGGGSGPFTSAATSDPTTTAGYNPAYLALDYYTGASAPAAGTLAPVAGTSAPAGWLIADGACVSETTYAALYAAIGSAYGSCPVGEFKLPNMPGRFPLGKATSGTGTTLGEVGGSLDITPSAALGNFTPASIEWTPSNFSFSVPSRTATLTLGSNYDHQYAGSTYSSVLWNGSGSFSSSAFGATTFTATPTPGGARTVNGTPTGATTASFPTENPPFQVVNYLIATGGVTGTDAFIPNEVRYDPAAGSQEQNRTTVYLTNNSATIWSANSVFLRYRWIAPDGSITSSANLSLGSDVAPAASRAVQVDFEPPTLPANMLRSLYTLRLDLVDTSSGTTYFAGVGNKPLEKKLLVTRVTPLELGLERYQQYEPLDLGAGLTSSANLGNGNLIVSGNLLDNPGRGLSTLLDLAYSSQEPASFAPAGNGVTLGSGLARLGQPLDIHPNPSDTALGRTGKWIGFADADGSYHRFEGRAIAGGDTYYDEPAGVHLYLRATGSSDPTKYWALTRADRVSFYFDESGWPTRVEEADGNALVYTLASVAAAENAYGATKRITKITDAGGREVTLTYYTKVETATPAVRGKLKSITDHAGRLTHFDYYDDGNLLRVTQAGGVGDDGSFAPTRSFVFAYTNAAGSGPAIATLAARQNPDPAAAQGRLLYSLLDYRGNETSFEYSSAGATAGRLSAWTDRVGKTTSFTYNTATPATTVARPLTRTSTYEFDSQGRVTEIANPLGLETTVAWTTGNKVSQVTNVTTGRSTAHTYNANGYLTSSTDEQGNETRLSYENLAVDADDATGNWPTGRSIPHLSQLDTRTLPKGVATTGVPGDYQWSFDYTASGNLWKVFDPLGNVTTNTYNTDGTLATTTLPANGDGITRTTSYESYDANGLPTQVKDASGNRAKAAYGADGRPLWLQDPLHYTDTGSDTRSYRQVFDYDGHGRLSRAISPKSSTWARGLLIWSETRYDANDNVVSETSPYYAIDAGGYGTQSNSSYDAMDRVVSVVGPDTSSGGTEETQMIYDDAGRLAQQISPKGVRTAPGSSDDLEFDFSSITSYDLVDRPVSETRYQLTGGVIDGSKTRTSVSCYDAAGDLRSVTGPKGASGFSCPSATAWLYTPTTQTHTTKVVYDAAHQPTTVTDPLGRSTSTEYDANGSVTKETDPLAKERTFEHNERGDQVKLVQPFETGRTLTSLTEYDPLGNVKREISPRAYDVAFGGPSFTQFVTSYSYDALGQLVRVSLPKASAETQTYTHTAFDANGRLVWTSLPTTQDAPGSIPVADKTANDYWDTGQLYSTSVGGSPKVRYDYTAERWQAWRLPETAEGTGTADYARMMLWEYFPDGLLAAERDFAGQRSAYGYDANGNQTSASEAQSIAGEALSITSGFNGFDELERVQTPKSGSSNLWVSLFGYDKHGNVESLEENREEASAGSTVAAGRLFGYSYDGADQPSEQTDDFASTGTLTDDERYSFEFDELGQIKKRTVAKRTGSSSYATEQTQETSYFFNGLPKTLVSKDGTATTIASHTLAYIQGGVYLNGNKTQDVFRVANPDTNAPCRTSDCTASWEYDGRERLTKAIDGTGTTSEFTLDPAGNVTLEKRNGATHRNPTYTGQRLTTDNTGGVSTRYLYDAQGNVDCVVLASWVSNTCPSASSGQTIASELLSDNVYDYRNRLVAVRGYNSGAAGDKTEYRYDPLSRPVKKTATDDGTTTTTDMVYLGVSDAVVRETETGAATKTRSYAFDVLGNRAGLSETISGTISRYTYVYDPLGSTELLLDQSNGVNASYGYTAYGEANPQLTKTASGFTSNTNLYRYTGKRWDPAAKAYDMAARHYFPGPARWFQQDVYSDALENIELSTDPLTQNRYSFAAANPINNVEVDGHVVDPGGAGSNTSPQVIDLPGGYGEETAQATGDLDLILGASGLVKKGGAKIVKRVTDRIKGGGRSAVKALPQTALEKIALGLIKGSPTKALAVVALSVEKKGVQHLRSRMSLKQRAAYDKNPDAGSRFLGSVLHKETADRLQALFPGRFVYDQKNALTRNHRVDFFDTKTKSFIDIVTPGGLANHNEKYKYLGNRVSFVVWRPPGSR